MDDRLAVVDVEVDDRLVVGDRIKKQLNPFFDYGIVEQPGSSSTSVFIHQVGCSEMPAQAEVYPRI